MFQYSGAEEEFYLYFSFLGILTFYKIAAPGTTNPKPPDITCPYIAQIQLFSKINMSIFANNYIQVIKIMQNVWSFKFKKCLLYLL